MIILNILEAPDDKYRLALRLTIFYFTNYGGYAGKLLEDPRVLTDVGDVPVQELRDCGVNDDKLMDIISESVKLVMEEVRNIFCRLFVNFMLFNSRRSQIFFQVDYNINIKHTMKYIFSLCFFFMYLFFRSNYITN